MKHLYEITGAGFYGGTDETDDRVLWVAAANEQQVLDAIKDTGADFCGMLPDDLDYNRDGDFDLTTPGGAMLLGTRLLEFVGMERNKTRVVPS